ncbi:MAG TPA: CdaR family protein [Anaerolineales bacterium]|nr:CdaR family protein [Anaerolineales bacterium]
MRLFAKNIRTVLLSLILGFSVWISAVTAADPDEERSVINLPLEIVGQETSLVITNEIPSSIRVTLRAPRSVWDQLTREENAVRAVLDLTGLSADEHELEVQVLISARPVQILRKEPETVIVHLEPLAIRTLPIVLSLSGQPAIGYQAGEATIEPAEVILSGPESLVNQVERARVLVRLDGLRESIDQSMKIEVLDEQNTRLEGITINPESARVSIPVSQQGGFRDVAVKVVVQGQQAAGYRLENISVFPPVVTVFAEDPELVIGLPGIVETEPLNLQDAKQDIATRLALDLPEGVTIVSAQAQTVQVQVAISPIQTSLTLLRQPITLIGLPEEFSAQIFPETVDVIISGPLPVLEALTPQDITVTVDVTGLDVGTHQLEPELDALVDNVLEESILPSTVEVIISVPITPTVTPNP